MNVDTLFEHGQSAGSGIGVLLGDYKSENVETTVAQATADEPASSPLADVWSETAIAQSASEAAKPEEFNASDAAWLLLPLWFAVVWVVLFFAFSEGWRITQSKFRRLQPASRVPCRHCRFYNSSAYLKCAVNPLDAATEKAIACSDYDAKQIEEPSNSAQHGNSVKFR